MSNAKTALITGASSGIGYELAKVFAENKYNLILVARNNEKLNELSKQLQNQYEIKVNIIIQDLTVPRAAKIIFDEVQKLVIRVDVLINNAGAGVVGMFSEIPADEDFKMIQLNVTALTELTKLFLKEMLKNNKGKILNIASTGSFSPGPFTAVYYATKAYVLSFSEAIAEEVKPYNITVSALCPGATKTNFAKRAGKEDSKVSMNPEVVAKIAYDGLLRNKRVIVPGFRNKVFIKLPRNILSKMVGKYQRGLSK